MPPAHHLSALALGAALVVVPASPASAAETCRGEVATIVGSEGATLTGTAGRDVVVTNNALDVNTGGGDDLVCVTGRTFSGGSFKSVDVSTGPGSDVVDGTGARSWAAYAVLGEGSDQFYGGPQGDSVVGGIRSADLAYTIDSEPDTIGTGAGNDGVNSGDDTATNLDVVDLGTGDDGVTWRGAGGTVAGRIDAGVGDDHLSTTVVGGSLSLDNAAGRGARNGLPLVEWSGLEDFYLSRMGPAATYLEFVGGNLDESVTLWTVGDQVPAGITSVTLGRGDDALRTDSPGAPRSGYDGGSGRDFLAVAAAEPDGLALDLMKGRLQVNGVWHATAAGFEDAQVIARVASVRGTPGRNSLSATGCSMIITGRAGPDSLQYLFDGVFETFTFDCHQRARLSGGRGHDQLRGSLGTDRLVGNAGRDRADGRAGNDLCRAETTKKCERR